MGIIWHQHQQGWGWEWNDRGGGQLMVKAAVGYVGIKAQHWPFNSSYLSISRVKHESDTPSHDTPARQRLSALVSGPGSEQPDSR